MSRRINSNQVHTDEQIQALQNSSLGKLIFTPYKGEMCALLICENRLVAARVLNGENNRIGAIYIGKIKNAVKNIHAYFVEIADREVCFLSEKEAVHPILLNRKYDGRLLEGDEILVQLSREAQKGKQASLTANISLSNEYAAIAIGSPKIGYSGKLTMECKEKIKGWLSDAGLSKSGCFSTDKIQNEVLQNQDNMPHFDEHVQAVLSENMGLVIRTKALECSGEDLLQHIKELFADFINLITSAQHRTCFSCVRQAANAFEMILDELAYDYEYDEIVTDDTRLYEDLLKFATDRHLQQGIRLYQDANFSLSKLYALEQKFDTALNARVWLKSGGYLVIEHTEALTVIDVNTGKYEATTKGTRTYHPSGSVATEHTSKNVAGNPFLQTAYKKINWEAAEEVARQLRLRNLSGIILVDFINMETKTQEDELLSYLRELVRKDKIKTNVIDITPLGLVEITRKKCNRPLREQLGRM